MSKPSRHGPSAKPSTRERWRQDTAYEVLALSIGKGVVDRSPDNEGEEWVAFVWESAAEPGYFHIAGWRDASDGSDALAEVVSTGRPIWGERPDAVFACIDAIIGCQRHLARHQIDCDTDTADMVRMIAIGDGCPREGAVTDQTRHPSR